MAIPSFLNDFYETQLKNWEVAANNFEALKRVKKKPFKAGDLEGYVQFNPARKSSTIAKVDPESIKVRKCFLCEENRPEEQLKMEILEDFDLLVNPFPILPYHFTIASRHHIPQEYIPETGIKLAKKLPGMVVFYNDPGAGASAPDHLHFQAVPKKSLPLINLIEEEWDKENNKDSGIPHIPLDLPFEVLVLSGHLATDPNLFPQKWPHPINAFFWRDEEKDYVRTLTIGRNAHRPDCYFLEPPLRRAFSPGAIDMAGVLVTPFEEDFNKITDPEIYDIYRQVGRYDNSEYSNK